jgi:hypothetical protein
MERISGVQEALSGAMSAPGNPETATAVNVQQSGTQARTSSNRDSLELMLTDLAQYTAEQALQSITVQEAQRIAGPLAFWPEGMSIEDLFTLVEIKIEAGTTGKPTHQVDQQAWATILPLIQKMMVDIRQAMAVGDKALANSYIELIKETMKRMGDETDPDRFIPQVPPPGSPGAGAPPPAIMPKITVQLKGAVGTATAEALAQPAVTEDQIHAAAVAALQRPQLPEPGSEPPPGPNIAPAPGPAPGAAPPMPTR